MIAALYRLALRAFPKLHRDLYQAEMLDAFERALAARRAAGTGAVATFVAAVCLDAISAGFADRRRRRVVRCGYAFSSLDFILAWRMMRRYPGLSVVGVFAMAVGIAVAAGAFTVVAMLMDTLLPLPDGDRVVAMVSQVRPSESVAGPKAGAAVPAASPACAPSLPLGERAGVRGPPTIFFTGEPSCSTTSSRK